MSILKQLKFVPAPSKQRDPIENHRITLIRRLEEQKKLAEDPNYVRTTTRFTGKGEDRKQVTRTQKVRPWFRQTGAGVVMSVYRGGTPMEFEKGKAAIAAVSIKELVTLMDKLIEATRGGELDEIIAKTPTKRVGNKKRAA